jgi:hypothetical protein
VQIGHAFLVLSWAATEARGHADGGCKISPQIGKVWSKRQHLAGAIAVPPASTGGIATACQIQGQGAVELALFLVASE